MVLSFPFVFFLVPETSECLHSYIHAIPASKLSGVLSPENLPIEAMDDLWSGKHKAWKAHRIVMDDLQAKHALNTHGEGTRQENMDDGTASDDKVAVTQKL